jgi:hypothetical protein
MAVTEEPSIASGDVQVLSVREERSVSYALTPIPLGPHGNVPDRTRRFGSVRRVPLGSERGVATAWTTEVRWNALECARGGHKSGHNQISPCSTERRATHFAVPGQSQTRLQPNVASANRAR